MVIVLLCFRKSHFSNDMAEGVHSQNMANRKIIFTNMSYFVSHFMSETLLNMDQDIFGPGLNES